MGTNGHCIVYPFKSNDAISRLTNGTKSSKIMQLERSESRKQTVSSQNANDPLMTIVIIFNEIANDKDNLCYVFVLKGVC